jgi:hypothetical protein
LRDEKHLAYQRILQKTVNHNLGVVTIIRKRSDGVVEPIPYKILFEFFWQACNPGVTIHR